MVQGAKHMKSNNAAANGGSSPQPKPQPKPKRRRKRLPRWADRLITIVIILIGVGLMTWPWILDRLEASGVFNQISTDRADVAFAGSALYILPTLLIYLYFQEDIVAGIQLSELK